jgi:transitional endoplasmic reticulum ATPase
LEKLLRSELSTAVIVTFAEHVCPAQDTATMAPDDRAAQIVLRTWGTDKVIKDRGNVVFLVTELLTDLSPAIRSASACWHAIDLPLPQADARERFIQAYLDSWRLPLEMTVPELARATAGLSLVHIENIFLQADACGTLTWDLVRMAKAQIISSEYAGLLTIMEPTYGFEAVGGMEPLKNWARTEVMAPVRAGRVNDVPGGVLFVGPPGTGKSHFVRALAKEVGFNAVALNLEKIMSKWQGQSERDMARALGVVKSLSPVMLFMDELDQSEGASRGQNSGSPRGKNIFNQLLQFLADPENRGRVIFFGASNRPDLIDPALMRFGRIDAIIPVMLPNRTERLAVAQAAARSQGMTLIGDAALALADGSDRYSCADMAALVTKARKAAIRADRVTIGVEQARVALATIRPATLKQAAYYEALALDACNDTELLPAEYAQRLDDRGALQKEINAAQVEEPMPRRKREL